MAVHSDRRRRLYRSQTNRLLAGVAGGIGEYLGIDPTIVRVVWVLVTLLLPPALILDVLIYLALWIIIPSEPVA